MKIKQTQICNYTKAKTKSKIQITAATFLENCHQTSRKQN